MDGITFAIDELLLWKPDETSYKPTKVFKYCLTAFKTDSSIKYAE